MSGEQSSTIPSEFMVDGKPSWEMPEKYTRLIPKSELENFGKLNNSEIELSEAIAFHQQLIQEGKISG